MVAPLEFLAIEFPGNHFKGEIMPEVVSLVDKGLMRIIDLVLIRKDQVGKVKLFELNEFDKETTRMFAPLRAEVRNMLSKDDIEKVGSALSKNSTAALFLFEHTWSTRFVQAVKNADGRVIADYRIPQEVVEKALELAGSTSP